MLLATTQRAVQPLSSALRWRRAPCASRHGGTPSPPPPQPRSATQKPFVVAALSKTEPATTTVSEAAAENVRTSAANRRDFYRAFGTGAAVSVLAAVLDHDVVEEHQSIAMWAVFGLGCARLTHSYTCMASPQPPTQPENFILQILSKTQHTTLHRTTAYDCLCSGTLASSWRSFWA